MLAAFGAFAAIVPTASADTALPVWTCRASAGYVETGSLGSTRAEPVLANGFAQVDDPATAINESDSPQCNSTDAGVQDVNIPAGAAGTPVITTNDAFARTRLTPEIGAARSQDVLARGGVTNTTVAILGLTIETDAVFAQALGRCTGTDPNLTPSLSGSSEVINLRINGNQVVNLPTNGTPVTVDGIIITIRLNEQVLADTPDGKQLTQRALRVEVLPSLVPGVAPLATVVVGEAKADYHGAVCAPPPVPTCPNGSVLQPGSNPAVCVLTVIQCAPGSTANTSAPGTCVQVCPAGSTADPNAGGACVLVRPAPCPTGTTTVTGGACLAAPTPCATGTVRDPAGSNNCILVVQRPCPTGSIPDPATRVCVLPITRTVGSSGENGRIGSPTGPRATCGRLQMHFVRGRSTNAGRSFTSRFGIRTVTRGRLVTCGANPRSIIGARIDVVHVLSNGQRRRKTGLRSRAFGRLTLILPNDLRSRRIEYAYRPNLNTTRVTSRVVLRLTVRNRAGRIVR